MRKAFIDSGMRLENIKCPRSKDPKWSCGAWCPAFELLEDKQGTLTAELSCFPHMVRIEVEQ